MRKRQSNNGYGFAIILTLILGRANAGIFNDSNRGWFFYESKPVIESVQVESKPIKQLTPGEKASQELEQLQKQLKEASALALLYPTPENVWNYQQLKTKIYDMSSVLTDQQVRNDWSRPDSYSANNPTGGEGLEINRKEQNACTADLIRQSGYTYGLYLFTSANCKYCDAQVNVLKKVSTAYGVSSMVVSFDGSRPNNLDDIPFGQDKGIMSKKFNVINEGKPVTVMFNIKTGQSQVLGYGYIPLDQVNNRICRFYTKQLGEF